MGVPTSPLLVILRRLGSHILLEAKPGEPNADHEALLADAGRLTRQRAWIAVDERVHRFVPTVEARGERG